MLNRYPKRLPDLVELLQDPLLAHLQVTDLARAFRVSERTVRRWKNGKTPQSVRLSLWAFSTEGLASRDVEAVNLARIHIDQADALQRENDALRARVHYLAGLRDHGAANDPLWAVESARPAGPRTLPVPRDQPAGTPTRSTIEA